MWYRYVRVRKINVLPEVLIEAVFDILELLLCCPYCWFYTAQFCSELLFLGMCSVVVDNIVAVNMY